jgi:hypothetical protein
MVAAGLAGSEPIGLAWTLVASNRLTTSHEFLRIWFPGLKWFNPLTEA